MEVIAVCHIHSSWSYDGSWSLKELAAKFAGQGCRIVMMTEHDRGFTASRFKCYREACAKASSTEVLLVPGIEYSDAANLVHVLVWGSVPFLGEGLSTIEVLKAVKASDGVAVLAHPSRKGAWQCFEPSWAEHLLGIEVWNRKYDGWAPSKTASPLLRGANVIPFVGLDFHTQHQSFPLTMALEMQESIVSESGVLDCLRARRCHPLALGAPLTQNLFRTVLPAFRIAERSRRTVARIARRSGVLSR